VGADLADEPIGILLEGLWRGKWLPSDKFAGIPAPLNSGREKLRGFNQPTLLGKILDQKFEFCFDGQILVKIKDTELQVELKAKEREI